MKSIEELCDKYSESILKRSGKFVYSGNNPTLIIPSDEERLEHQLELDGYLKMGKNNIYHLTGEGRIFLERGGYMSLKNRIIQKEKLELEQLESVIKTNKSVKSTNNLQKASLIITGAAIVFSAALQYQSLVHYREQLQLDIKKQKSDSLKETYLMEKIPSIQKQIDSMQNEKKKQNK